MDTAFGPSQISNGTAILQVGRANKFWPSQNLGTGHLGRAAAIAALLRARACVGRGFPSAQGRLAGEIPRPAPLQCSQLNARRARPVAERIPRPTKRLA